MNGIIPVYRPKSRFKRFSIDELEVWKKHNRLVVSSKLFCPEDIATEITYRDLKIKKLEEQIEKYKKKLKGEKVVKQKVPDSVKHNLPGNILPSFLRKFVSSKSNLTILKTLEKDIRSWHFASISLFGKSNRHIQYLISAYSAETNSIEFYNLICLSTPNIKEYRLNLVLQDEQDKCISEITLSHVQPDDFNIRNSFKILFKGIDTKSRKLAYCKTTSLLIGKTLSINALAKRCLILKQ